MWPMLVDMTRDECKSVLRRLELEAYSSVVSALRAQGELNKDRKKILSDLCGVLSISSERHRAEIRRAVNDEKLTTISENLSGGTHSAEWAIEGRRLVPLMPRLVPQTALTAIGNQISNLQNSINSQLPMPHSTISRRVDPSVHTQSVLVAPTGYIEQSTKQKPNYGDMAPESFSVGSIEDELAEAAEVIISTDDHTNKPPSTEVAPVMPSPATSAPKYRRKSTDKTANPDMPKTPARGRKQSATYTVPKTPNSSTVKVTVLDQPRNQTTNSNSPSTAQPKVILMSGARGVALQSALMQNRKANVKMGPLASTSGMSQHIPVTTPPPIVPPPSPVAPPLPPPQLQQQQQSVELPLVQQPQATTIEKQQPVKTAAPPAVMNQSYKTTIDSALITSKDAQVVSQTPVTQPPVNTMAKPPPRHRSVSYSSMQTRPPFVSPATEVIRPITLSNPITPSITMTSTLPVASVSSAPLPTSGATKPTQKLQVKPAVVSEAAVAGPSSTSTPARIQKSIQIKQDTTGMRIIAQAGNSKIWPKMTTPTTGAVGSPVMMPANSITLVSTKGMIPGGQPTNVGRIINMMDGKTPITGSKVTFSTMKTAGGETTGSIVTVKHPKGTSALQTLKAGLTTMVRGGGTAGRSNVIVLQKGQYLQKMPASVDQAVAGPSGVGSGDSVSALVSKEGLTYLQKKQPNDIPERGRPSITTKNARIASQSVPNSAAASIVSATSAAIYQKPLSNVVVLDNVAGQNKETLRQPPCTPPRSQQQNSVLADILQATGITSPESDDSPVPPMRSELQSVAAKGRRMTQKSMDDEGDIGIFREMSDWAAPQSSAAEQSNMESTAEAADFGSRDGRLMNEMGCSVIDPSNYVVNVEQLQSMGALPFDIQPGQIIEMSSEQLAMTSAGTPDVMFQLCNRSETMDASQQELPLLSSQELQTVSEQLITPLEGEAIIPSEGPKVAEGPLTTATEVAPVEGFVLESGVRVLSSGVRVLPCGDRVLPSGERVLPAGEEVEFNDHTLAVAPCETLASSGIPLTTEDVHVVPVEDGRNQEGLEDAETEHNKDNLTDSTTSTATAPETTEQTRELDIFQTALESADIPLDFNDGQLDEGEDEVHRVSLEGADGEVTSASVLDDALEYVAKNTPPTRTLVSLSDSDASKGFFPISHPHVVDSKASPNLLMTPVKYMQGSSPGAGDDGTDLDKSREEDESIDEEQEGWSGSRVTAVVQSASTSVAVMSCEYDISNMQMEDFSSQKFNEDEYTVESANKSDFRNPFNVTISSYTTSTPSTSSSIRIGRKRHRSNENDDIPVPTSFSSSSSGWHRAAGALLAKVCKFRGSGKSGSGCAASQWFLEPVSIDDEPGYYDLISEPMDLSTVRKKLEGGEYSTMDAFYSDMMLIRSNCQQYNPPEHEVSIDCEELFIFFQNEYHKLIDKWQKTHLLTPPSLKKSKPL